MILNSDDTLYHEQIWTNLQDRILKVVHALHATVSGQTTSGGPCAQRMMLLVNLKYIGMHDTSTKRIYRHLRGHISAARHHRRQRSDEPKPESADDDACRCGRFKTTDTAFIRDTRCTWWIHFAIHPLVVGARGQWNQRNALHPSPSCQHMQVNSCVLTGCTVKCCEDSPQENLHDGPVDWSFLIESPLHSKM